MTGRRRALAVGVASALAVAALLTARVAGPAESWAGLAVPGADQVDPERFPYRARFEPGMAYDGQYYLALAIDPWPEQPTVAGIHLDYPAHRHHRIAYPALAWAVSLGREEWAPQAMALVNVLAVGVAAGALAAVALRVGLPAWSGMAVLLVPGITMAAARDLTEPVVVAGLTCAGLALLHGRAWPAAAALTVAALARGEALLAALSLLPLAPLPALLPFGAVAGWYALVDVHWNDLPVGVVTDQFSPPLLGLGAAVLEDVGGLGGPGRAEAAVELLGVVWHLAALALVATAAWRARALPPTDAEPGEPTLRRWATLGLALWAVFAAVLAVQLWSDDWAFARLLAPGVALGGLVAMTSGWRPAAWFSAFTGAMAAGTVLRLLVRV